MTNSQRLANVRACILRWLSEQHVDNAEPDTGSSDILAFKSPIHRESLLIRDEFFVGRRFHSENHTAVWFVEEDELKIYHHDGSLACVFNSQQISDGNIESEPSHDSNPAVIKLPTAGNDQIRRAA
ncbi:MAG: hypothetical protein AB8B91_19325 [Rubripirellula sp.]